MFNHPLSTHQSQIGKHGLQQEPDKTATSKPRQKHQHLVNLAQKLARGECADPSPICCGLYLWYSELTKEHTELVDYRNLQIFRHVRCNPYFYQCSTGNNMCIQYTAENLIYPPFFQDKHTKLFRPYGTGRQHREFVIWVLPSLKVICLPKRQGVVTNKCEWCNVEVSFCLGVWQSKGAMHC